MGGDVLLGLGREQIVRVLGRAARTAVIGNGGNTLRGVGIGVPHPVVEVILGGAMVQVAVESCETVMIRQTIGRVDRGTGIAARQAANAIGAETPFAENGRGVAGRRDHLRRQHFVCAKACCQLAVAIDVGVARMKPGIERCPAGRAYRAGVRVRELHAAGGQRIEIRRLDLRLAVEADAAKAQIIREDMDDVRSLCLGPIR